MIFWVPAGVVNVITPGCPVVLAPAVKLKESPVPLDCGRVSQDELLDALQVHGPVEKLTVPEPGCV